MTKIAGASDPAVALRNWFHQELHASEERITIRIERIEKLLLERPVPKPDARYGAALRAALDDIAIAINEQKQLNGE